MNTVKGLEEFVGATQKLTKVKQEFANEFLKRVKEKTPVLTGLLKDSWVVTVKQGKINLTNDAKNEEGREYVAYVEYGTHRFPGFFMVSLTMMEAEDILQVAKKNAGL
jgi:uncharacterized protein CbrC (UPF0167 family)